MPELPDAAAAAGTDEPIADTAAADPARSRRNILAAAAGAMAGLIGSRLVAPESAAAANGDSLRIGQSNSATSNTTLTSTSAQGLIVYGRYTGASLRSNDPTGIGVDAGAGSTGASTNYGVYAQAWGSGGAGVLAFSGNSSTGVVGYSRAVDSTAPAPKPQKKTGVYGHASQDAGAIGVLGESAAGLGVKGKATTGSGVYGTTGSGYGVVGFGGTGVGGLFQTGSPAVGIALQAIGRVKFDKSVGRSSIAAGTNRVTVTPGIDLTATSAVVATLQGPAGGALVERVSIDTTSNTFTIWLTKNATLAASVAWHVFG